MESFHPSYGVHVIHCVCHRFALILTNAIEDQLVPKACVDLLHSLHEYLSKSPKKKKGMRELLAFQNANRRLGAGRARPEGAEQDEALERVLKTLEEKYKLPRRVVLTRWLSCESAVHVVVVCRDSYVIYFADQVQQPGASAKAASILHQLEDNSIIAWFYCLKDILPVLTAMNCLFQSSLPLPHLLYDKVQSAKQTFINMVGRGAGRQALAPLAEVTRETPFGAFANSFLDENTRGRCKSHGASLAPFEVLDLKQKWHKLIRHCIEQLDERFPPSNMLLFKYLMVADPELLFGPAPRASIGEKTLDEAAKELMHIFELPLRAGLLKKYEPGEIINSFLALQGSTFALAAFQSLYKTAKGQPPAPTVIFKFYAACLERDELRPWAFFALFLLIFPTGNAISERGFSHMGMAHSKQRSELSVEQCLAHMIIEFNGPSLEAFKNIIEFESKALKQDWWGYVNPCTLNV